MPSTWAALADPHRREMLALLRERPRVVGELVDALGLSQPGTSKHLRVLRDAGLVVAHTDAQRRRYELDPGPLAELDAWLEPYRRTWEARLDALEHHLDAAADRDAGEHHLMPPRAGSAAANAVPQRTGSTAADPGPPASTTEGRVHAREL
ncbi:ArsR/SmtB family transcription factor [Bradyrhizobium sp.]|uniref:ArsR/SmtB family transcription factor n=1 Tax=Bradyrhizobium sp. TaxID=376 RepID=UPI003C5EF093